MDFVTDRCRELAGGRQVGAIANLADEAMSQMRSRGDRIFGGGGAPEDLSAVPLEP